MTNLIAAFWILNTHNAGLEPLGLMKLILIPLFGVCNYFFVLYVLIGMVIQNPKNLHPRGL
jgi:hypothetical protein